MSKTSFVSPSVDSSTGTAFVSAQWLKREALEAKNLFMVTVQSNENAPRVCRFDELVINTAETNVVDGEFYAVRLGDDGPVVYRKLYALPHGLVELRSVGLKQKKITLRLARISILGRVRLHTADAGNRKLGGNSL